MMGAVHGWDSSADDLARARERVQEGELAELDHRVTDRAGHLASMERHRRHLQQLEDEARAREEADAELDHGGETA